MRKFGIGALALAALAASAFTTGGVAQASPPVDGPSGLTCGFSSVTDPGTEGGDVQTGEIDGGPLVVIEADNSTATGTLKCTIQVGGSKHSDPDNGASAAATGGPVVYLPPTLVSYNSPANVPVYLCTQFTYTSGPRTGETIYFVPESAPGAGDQHWSSNPDRECGLAISGGTEDADPIGELLDSILCPTVFTALAGVGVPGVVEFGPATDPDLFLLGDLFWDCPPYVD